MWLLVLISKITHRYNDKNYYKVLINVAFSILGQKNNTLKCIVNFLLVLVTTYTEMFKGFKNVYNMIFMTF